MEDKAEHRAQLSPHPELRMREQALDIELRQDNRARVLVLCGPTATGKTALSVTLAKRLNGEIVCADSMQIYRGLTVGTAKATPEEMQGVPHHLMDFLEPEMRFSVAEYVELARACIADIAARGRLPIVVGGTGLYVQSLVEGVRFVKQKTDWNLRTALQKKLETEGIDALYAELQAVDPVYAAGLHQNNHGRVLRALEVYRQTGQTMSQQQEASRPAMRPYHDILVGLNYATRDILYEKIDRRVERMMENGLLEEAALVYSHRDTYITAAQAIGYKELFPYFEGSCTLAACVEKLQQASRNYAKRQMTWFAHMPQLHWLPAADPEAAAQVEKMMPKAAR